MDKCIRCQWEQKAVQFSEGGGRQLSCFWTHKRMTRFFLLFFNHHVLSAMPCLDSEWIVNIWIFQSCRIIWIWVFHVEEYFYCSILRFNNAINGNTLTWIQTCGLNRCTAMLVHTENNTRQQTYENKHPSLKPNSCLLSQCCSGQKP